jgi:muramoyltetrapeptide carboxypeptidase
MVCKGGYGTVRIVDLLDFTAFKKQPKWIVGFSDVTVLHNHLNTLGFKFHGIMPITAPRATTQAIETLRMALFGEKLSYCSSFWEK